MYVSNVIIMLLFKIVECYMFVDIWFLVVILVLLESIWFSDVICFMNKLVVIMLINVFKYSDIFCDIINII